MKIGYFPPPNKANSYTVKMFNLLGRIGCISSVTPKKIVNFLKQPKFDFIFVNWLENKAFTNDGRLLIKGVIFSIVWFLMLKIKSKKIVYVKHNNFPHNSTGFGKWVGIGLIDFFIRNADIVAVHSPSSVTCNKTVYIPHPLYEIEYQLQDGLGSLNGEKEQEKYFSCFGRIEKYKKIDELIKYWPNDIPLKIQGVCHDEKYLKVLKLMSKGKLIKISSEFISDDEAAQLLRGSQGVIIPSDSDSMIVSGSFFFAMSVKTPVIAIRSDFMSAFQNAKDFIFLIDSMQNVKQVLTALLKSKAAVPDDFVKNFSDEEILFLLNKKIFSHSV